MSEPISQAMHSLNVWKPTDTKFDVPNIGDVGYDLRSIEYVSLLPNTPTKIDTGIHVAIPSGHVGKIEDRSSMGAKGIRVLGGVIDPSYRGNVMVILINLTDTPININAQDKIAQMLIIPVITPEIVFVETLEDLGDSERGEQGFGSTGA